MRIVSSFYDYYDKGVAWGIDPKLLYVREERDFVVEIPAFKRLRERKSLVDVHEMSLDMPPFPCGLQGIVCFCGRAYPFYKFVGPNEFSKTYYSVQDIRSDLVRNLKTTMSAKVRNIVDRDGEYSRSVDKSLENLSSFANDGKGKRKWSALRGSYVSLDPIEFDANKGKKISDSTFLEARAPIVVLWIKYRYGGYVDCLNGTVNRKLKDLNFASVFDPFSAFQEISAYVGNELAHQPDPQPRLTDETKRDLHGFDEWSFKNPGKKSRLHR